jgi:hypothetical protein
MIIGITSEFSDFSLFPRCRFRRDGCQFHPSGSLRSTENSEPDNALARSIVRRHRRGNQVQPPHRTGDPSISRDSPVPVVKVRDKPGMANLGPVSVRFGPVAETDLSLRWSRTGPTISNLGPNQDRTDPQMGWTKRLVLGWVCGWTGLTGRTDCGLN